MSLQLAGGKLLATGLLLLSLLTLLNALQSPKIFYKKEPTDGSQPDWQVINNLLESARGGQRAEDTEPEVQVEATKRLWISELEEKAASVEEAADLIEQIQLRSSGTGLRRLKAACRAICSRCVCGIILMPSLPAVAPAGAAKPAPKVTKKPTIKPVEATSTPTVKSGAATVTAKPIATGGTTVSPSQHPAASKEAVKKAKKWLSMASLEGELPDFLLDEGADADAYKKEVGDHDPLSRAFGDSRIGIE